jgi:hypothetical protein
MSRIANSCDVADFENMMALDNPIKTTKLARWERKANKARELQEQPADRFIPNRAGTDYDLQQSLSEDSSSEDSDGSSDYAKLLAVNTGSDGPNASEGGRASRILAFKNKAPVPTEGYQNSLKVLYSQQNGKKNGEVVKPSRHIASAPVRILVSFIAYFHSNLNSIN